MPTWHWWDFDHMKIGFDASPIIQSVGGVARYARNLLKALLALESGDSFVGYVPVGASPNLNWSQNSGGEFLKWVEVGRYNFHQRGVLDQLDLYHGTNFKIQTSGRFGTILTIHDLWLDRHPEYSKKFFGQRLSFYRTRRRARHANRIIADSHFTAAEIQELYGIPAEKISVIHLGLTSDFFPDQDEAKFSELRQRIGLPNLPYIFFVGGADPRKNHRVLLQAFSHHLFLRQNYYLVVVGSSTSRVGSIQQTSQELGILDKVVCVNNVSVEDLRLLYSQAAVFVFPSRYEGFGFPVLEAMACGVPVIASKVSSIPEVAGTAALLVSPENEDELAHAITRVLQDPILQDVLRQQGLERSKAFLWSRTALETLKIYQEVFS